MTKYFPRIFVILLAVATTFAQSQVPKTTPPVDDVVRISTNLIQVDVTITDKSGNPIRDLKPGEVQIYENGKVQPISNFSFVPGARLPPKTSAESKAVKSNDLPVNLPSGPIRPEQVRRTIALVVDDLNLTFSSVVWVKEALKKFVNEQMQEGDLVAIIRTGGGIGMLQQFTNDKRQLFAAIEKVKFNLAGTARTSLFEPMSPSLNNELGIPNSDASKMDGIAAVNKDEQTALRSEIFAVGTLGALNYVVRGLKDLPGRKSVVLLSEGFRLVTTGPGRGKPNDRIKNPLENLIDLANRTSVVFYDIDPRGLQVVMKESQDDTSNMNSDAVINQRDAELHDTQDSLEYLAQQTGGIAVLNQNDINRGIRQALDDQSYYLVGYMPNDETFDAKKVRYNQLDVRVTRPGANVRYRSGFFSVANENTSNKLDPTAAIVDAITSPFAASGVTVRMNALFVGDAQRGLNLRAFINIDPKDITFIKMPDGKYKAVFDVFAMTYGDNGMILDQRYSRATVLADQNEYEKIQKRGMVSDLIVSVKKPGGYQLRLAIRDKESGRVGSANQFVAVPDLSQKQLSVSGAVIASEAGSGQAKISASNGPEKALDPRVDTSIRQFKRGSVLRYDYYVYNAKLDASQKANLNYKLNLYRDGKLVFESQPISLPILNYDSPTTISTSGSLQIGQEMIPGDYILRAVITDLNAGTKHNTVDQFVQFEIVD